MPLWIFSFGGRLAYFIEDYVLKKGRYWYLTQTLGLSSVQGYANKMVNLRKHHQLYDELLKLVESRGTLVDEIIGTIRREKAQKKRDEYADHVVDSINDGYNFQEYRGLGDYFMKENNNNTKGNRERLCFFLLGHAIFARSETNLAIKFADLSCLQLLTIGAIPCFALVIVIKFGKQNKYGKIQHSSAISHCNPETCAFGALVFNLFSRFHFENEEFPTLPKEKVGTKHFSHQSVSHQSQSAMIHMREFATVPLKQLVFSQASLPTLQEKVV